MKEKTTTPTWEEALSKVHHIADGRTCISKHGGLCPCQTEQITQLLLQAREDERKRFVDLGFEELEKAEQKATREAWKDALDSLHNNPYEEWDMKRGRTREREKQLWAGWEEAKDKLDASFPRIPRQEES